MLAVNETTERVVAELNLQVMQLAAAGSVLKAMPSEMWDQNKDVRDALSGALGPGEGVEVMQLAMDDELENARNWRSPWPRL